MLTREITVLKKSVIISRGTDNKVPGEVSVYVIYRLKDEYCYDGSIKWNRVEDEGSTKH
jgi:hypothetical protein